MAWRPLRDATHIEVVESEASARSVLVEHFNDPFEVMVADDTDTELRQAAHAYVEALCAQSFIADELQLPPHWREAMDPASGAHPLFGWLPFDDPATHQSASGPRGSLRSTPAWDQVAVLFACDRFGKDNYLGSGFGLALATRLRQDGNKRKASFLGVSAALPYGVWKSVPSGPRLAVLNSMFDVDSLFRNPASLATIARAATLDDVAIRGVRFAASPDQWWIERRGIGLRRIDGLEVPHAVTMLTSGGTALPTTESITHVAALVADAVGDTQVFDADPSSATGQLVRPTRNDLATRRTPEPILPGVPQGPLEYRHPPGAAKPLVQVLCCPRFVKADGKVQNPPLVRKVSLNAGAPAVISDDASAIQAFRHTRELVRRLQAYGWSPANYFRLTAPEIRIFYRSGISPGPGKDGRTVNARVIPDGWPADAIRWNNPGPAINIHLAGGDLRVRNRARWAAGGPASPAIPMGIGIDKRWMWHEFGHVLLVASTGELEFRFAHSPGDAMAAIASDPDSLLQDARRGLTFPFVFIPRLHNRCAAHGWSWSGTMHQALAAVPDASHPRRKGYASEQILSSSLFRLYRCIGGDAVHRAPPGSLDDRRRASHYTLYLIMQAMQLMGDARIQATSTPAKFVHWLRQAQRHSGLWNITWKKENYTRVGGTLGKVIRWAFEAQGLYGAGNGPGSPENVDIYIQSSRPTIDAGMGDATDFGPGSYVPVPLHWQAAGAAPPRWQADPRAGIKYPTANGRVEVRVGNRGPAMANNVQVRLWVAAWPANANPPDWSPGTWAPCTAVGAAGPNTIPGKTQPLGQAFTFDLPPNPPTAPGRYILLAEASCDEDRPHTDTSLLLSCSTQPTPLVDLVANDNNLGLLVVTIPSA
ncbi:hypothetical protein WG902_19120 [Ramlibacter sp. PS3R-8]|uniref:hypothetical protein n=1 Tax=Ramlibacter sp. PS3R-8 TaxID=3133437 RepID=UPI0030B5AC6D